MALEDLGNDGFLPKSFTTIPAEAQPQETNTPPLTDGTVITETPASNTGTPAETTPSTPPDQFIEQFNTRLGQQFKSEDDIKALFGLQQKVTEYEGKVKEGTDYAKKLETYEKEIENLKNNNNSELFSKPLIRNAYVAQQLLDKYPDKDPDTLREIAMGDVAGLSDIDAVVKAHKIRLPKANEGDLKAAVLSDLGIDPTTLSEEWDSIAKTKLQLKAADARDLLNNIKQGIELPKTVTKEERDRVANENLQKRLTSIAPLKEEFSKFDKLKDERIEGFDFDVPNDYKSKLPDMFQAMFIDAGMENTPENKAAVIELRDALLLKQELPKIWDIAFKKGANSVQAKIDEELGNKVPPNTTTRTDIEASKDDLPGPGLSAFFANNM
jgi:hypothetical protein